VKIYISGPMSGIPGLNKQAFNNAEHVLQRLGHEVVNPVRNGVPDTEPWLTHMRADIKMLMDCDAVAYLPGSEGSRGAKVEMELARALGLPVLPYAKWL
jgi:nucleoside 2-deoxyribosyltransferase